MPELPEVETIRLQLAPRVMGLTIRDAHLSLPRMLEVGQIPEIQALQGSQILALRRHGKYLLLDLGRGLIEKTLVVHLGMTGQLTFHPHDQSANDEFVTLVSGLKKSVGPHHVDKHTHLVFDLEGGNRLYFRDPRTFGKLLLLPFANHGESPRLKKLGPDALGLKRQMFVDRLWARRGLRSVKSLLLDQSFVAGVGNIYADEACFTAGVRPQKKLKRITQKEAARLADAVEEALVRGLQNCGTSFSDYVGADGHPGSNQEFLKVYGRGGQECIQCLRPLKKATVAQRTTVWCGSCQR